MTCTATPGDNALADFIAQAVDAFVAQAVTQTYEATCLAGERDYLIGEDVEAIYRLVVQAMREHQWRPPVPARIVAACHQLNVPVQL
jgi:hypothetical protein